MVFNINLSVLPGAQAQNIRGGYGWMMEETKLTGYITIGSIFRLSNGLR
jgi:hypothetical protein